MNKGNKMNLAQNPDNLKNIKSNYRPKNMINNNPYNLNMNYSTNYKKKKIFMKIKIQIRKIIYIIQKIVSKEIII